MTFPMRGPSSVNVCVLRIESVLGHHRDPGLLHCRARRPAFGRLPGFRGGKRLRFEPQAEVHCVYGENLRDTRR